MKEMKAHTHTHKWEDILCSWIRRIGMLYDHNTQSDLYRLSVIPIKIPKHFLKYRKRS
jgi:hypothetical protein